MKVSVVVPVRNGARYLAECLNALVTQDFPFGDYEVIVVVDGSSDSSAEIAENFKVRLVENEKRQGCPRARNIGWHAALGEWVAFTDHDCIPSHRWLKHLVQAVNTNGENETPLGAAGRTFGYESKSAAARFVDLTCGDDAERHLAHPNFPFAPATNLMYRRSALEMVNGFDERYYSYDPCDLHYRLLQSHRGRFYFEPRAVVFHHHRKRWSEYFRQQFWYGQGYAQFLLHHKDRVAWSIWRELSAWTNLTKLALNACTLGDDDSALLRRGSYVKQLSQHLGFISIYWNPVERRRW